MNHFISITQAYAIDYFLAFLIVAGFIIGIVAILQHVRVIPRNLSLHRLFEQDVQYRSSAGVRSDGKSGNGIRTLDFYSHSPYVSTDSPRSHMMINEDENDLELTEVNERIPMPSLTRGNNGANHHHYSDRNYEDDTNNSMTVERPDNRSPHRSSLNPSRIALPVGVNRDHHCSKETGEDDADGYNNSATENEIV